MIHDRRLNRFPLSPSTVSAKRSEDGSVSTHLSNCPSPIVILSRDLRSLFPSFDVLPFILNPRFPRIRGPKFSRPPIRGAPNLPAHPKDLHAIVIIPDQNVGPPIGGMGHS